MMKNRVILVIILFASIFFVGCSRWKDEISFSVFSISTIGEVLTAESENNNSTYIIKNKRNQLGDSLVVNKIPIDQQSNLNSLVDNNIISMNYAYPHISLDNQESNTISCDNRNIDTKLLSWTLDDDLQYPLYFAQLFFIYNNDAWLISYASTDERARKNMIRSFKRVACGQ